MIQNHLNKVRTLFLTELWTFYFSSKDAYSQYAEVVDLKQNSQGFLP